MSGHSLFKTDLADVAADFLATNYTEVSLSLADTESSFRFGVRRLDAGPFQFDEMEIAATAGFAYEPGDIFIVSRPTRGRLRFADARGEERFAAGELALIGRPRNEACTEVADYRQDVVVLRGSALREAAGLAVATEEVPVFTSARPVSTSSAAAWRRGADFVAGMLRENPEIAAAPLVIGSAERLLASLLLATFPNTAIEAPRRRDQRDARSSGTVRRAVSFIDSNADLDIGIGDIAAAARVSRRAVQLAFRRHLNTTPTAYLRSVRLGLAHDELLAASPDDNVTVTDVAYRWGFSSPSRFAERYRAAFGRSPSESLYR